MTVQEKIHEYLSVHRDEMVEDIKTLIKVDSARAEALPGKPYGEGAAEALHAGLSLFEKHGFLGKNWDNYAIDTVINGKELGLINQCLNTIGLRCLILYLFRPSISE